MSFRNNRLENPPISGATAWLLTDIAEAKGWHEAKHDLKPWSNYFLAIMRRAYLELIQQAGGA